MSCWQWSTLTSWPVSMSKTFSFYGKWYFSRAHFEIHVDLTGRVVHLITVRISEVKHMIYSICLTFRTNFLKCYTINFTLTTCSGKVRWLANRVCRPVKFDTMTNSLKSHRSIYIEETLQQHFFLPILLPVTKIISILK